SAKRLEKSRPARAMANQRENRDVGRGETPRGDVIHQAEHDTAYKWIPVLAPDVWQCNRRHLHDHRDGKCDTENSQRESSIAGDSWHEARAIRPHARED